MRRPSHVTLFAHLPSDGYADGRATRHKWVETRDAEDGVEHVYECQETGAQRRWGLECSGAAPALPQGVA